MLIRPFFGGQQVQDFSSFTEVDANNKLTVTATTLTGADIDRDEDVYCYKSFGASHFDALHIEFEILQASTSTATSRAGPGLTASVTNDVSGFATTDLAVHIRYNGTNYILQLIRGNFVATDESSALSADTVYYCTLKRAAGNDNAYLYIYSDSARTTLVDTLTVAGYSTTKYGVLYGIVNFNDASAGENWDGYVQNMVVY